MPERAARMAHRLLDLRMGDGARHFLEAPAGLDMADVLARLVADPDITVIDVLPGHTGSWLAFSFVGLAFSANDPFGEVWLFAEDGDTPEPVLAALAERLFPSITGA